MENLVRSLDKVDAVIYKIQKFIFIFVVSILVVVTSVQIAGRYLFSYNLSWANGLSLLIFCIIIIYGGNIAIKENSEIKITLISFKNPRKQAAFDLVQDAISIGTILILIYSCITLINKSLHLKNEIQSLQLDYKYVYMMILVGFLIILFDKIIATLKTIATLKSAPVIKKAKGGDGQ